MYAGKETNALLEEVKNRFKKIYKSISSIDYKINEDEVLIYTMRVYFNSLWVSGARKKVSELLTQTDSVKFVMEFSRALAMSFDYLSTFFGKDERENHAIHSLVTLGGIAVACPFIIKAYQFGLDVDTIGELCSALESIVLRHRVIGTKAYIESRINSEFVAFTKEYPSIQPIVNRIQYFEGDD